MIAWITEHPLFRKKTLQKFLLGSFLDFSPPLTFIIVFELSDFYTATAWFMAVTVLITGFAVFVEKRVPYFSIYISCITLGFGFWTLFLHDPDFVQMRDTFYDAVLALTLFIGMYKGKLFFKSAFSHSLIMTDYAWRKVTQAWILFFVFGGIANEVARRLFDEAGWVYFKIVVILATLFFGLWVLFYYYEPTPPTQEGEQKKL